MRGWVAVLVLLGACQGDGEPAWALDTLWLEATAGGAHGFHTWELFSSGWARRLSERHYLCAVVVEVDGEMVASGCDGCDPTWAVRGEVLESDCDQAWVDDPRWGGLVGVALGPLGMELVDEDPHPGLSQGGYADYGDGWLPHGWAWPDGERGWVLWPAWAWELE